MVKRPSFSQQQEYELELENTRGRWKFRIWSVSAAALVVIFYIVAGKSTSVSFPTKWEVDFGINKWLMGGLILSGLVNIGFIVLTVMRESFFRRKIREMGETNQRLEERIDASRTSSGLGPDGRTRDGD